MPKLGFLLLIFVAKVSFASTLPEPLTKDDFLPVNERHARVGHFLFYDKLLSGNRNIACSTCHHPSFGSSDGVSLSFGEGGVGLGPNRTAGEGERRAKRRVPRNAPALWNLGARADKPLFHDGRLFISDLYPSGFNSPAEEFLPLGLTDAVAAQALFPMTSEVEMAGHKNENPVPGAVARRIDYGWREIVTRLRANDEYVQLFSEAFNDVSAAPDITIVHVGNALSAFQRFEFRADNSPFDRYLKGDKTALTEKQKRGMALFYGEAGCSHCHQGALQMDGEFHNLAIPPLGPGRTRRFEFKARDMGRINETDWGYDAYKFRTPSLRNVTETSPYGHNGAYKELEDMIRHHRDPLTARKNYQLAFAVLPQDARIGRDDLLWQDQRELALLASTVTSFTPTFSDEQLPDLIAFLEALTDEQALAGRLGIPERVPSALPVDRVE